MTFVVYGLDKRAAVRGRRRTPEASMHLLALLGGFVGALLAQQAFRHKRRKAGFVLLTWTITALHAAGWVIWLRQR